MNPQTFTEIKKLAEKIATELVFAAAGKDLGLLPINSLLGQIEEIAAGQAPPESFAQATKIARAWVDRILETTGMFSEADLKLLGEWATWFQQASQACAEDNLPPPLPAHWQEQPDKPAAAPSSQAENPPPLPKQAAPPEETALTLNLESDKELLSEFINESQEHLQNIEQGVLTLEENPTDADTLNSIFRAFHTFKGGSGFLNLTAIQTLAHELESLLELARQQKIVITPEVINLILAGGDTLKQFTNEIAARLSGSQFAEPILVPTANLLLRLRAVLSPDAKTPSPAAPPSGQPSAEPVAGQVHAAAARAAAPASSVKVDTLKLDSLIDLVGELVIAQSLVVQNPELSTLQSEKLTRDLARLGRISKDLQRTALALRMVPIRPTFQKMARLVRDLSAKLSKQVELALEGEDTELDRTIVEEISDPLIHMIRNSVDHGIEKPEARLKAGKPAKGTVILKAFHRGGNIVIEIKDDGAGLNRDRILAKAVEQGLVGQDEQLSESQIFSLILRPGFSTAEKVTDVSGRGVGMDVVRRNIEKLRGKIEIQSVEGEGSKFSIYLPLTLAIIDGLLVGVGEHRYIFPTLSVCESFQTTSDMIKTVQGRGEVVSVRGQLRPLLRLNAHLGIESASSEAANSVIVMLESGHETRCVLVDQLLGKQEVVIKSLGEVFRGNRCMAGAAILGDGRIGIILDPQALVHLDVKEAA
ncbi:MAG: chemotaxis protein CheA [Limisphaerales bacterium]